MNSIATATPTRIEVCPPACLERSAVRRLWHWLREPRGHEPPRDPLRRVRKDFQHCLADLPREHGVDLVEQVRCAASLRELWHLRAAIFHAIAMVHSQDEAQQRLAKLNRHFPTRSPRSGFGHLEA